MIIQSESDRWPGTVTICDQLTLPQVELIENAFELQQGDGDKVFFTVIDKRHIPAIIACVEKWELKNFPIPPTLETWLMQARKESHTLIRQIWEAILKVYTGEQEIPNE
jgi:hypothetical protein